MVSKKKTEWYYIIQCFGSIFIESGSESGSSKKSQSRSRKALNLDPDPDPSYFFTLLKKNYVMGQSHYIPNRARDQGDRQGCQTRNEHAKRCEAYYKPVTASASHRPRKQTALN